MIFSSENEKHRHQPHTPEQPDQHRRRPTTSQPQPTPPNHTPADLLKYDFAGALYTLIRAMGEPALTERRIAGDEGFNPHAQGAL